MKKSVICMIIIVLFMPLGVSAGKLVFLCEDYPPYSYRQNGNMKGIDADIVREICKRLGAEAKFKAMPFARILETMRKGRADASLGVYRNEERAKYMYFSSEPLYSGKTVILTRKESRITLAGLHELKGKKVGIIRGGTYGPEFDSDSKIIKIVCVETSELVTILSKKRVDFVVDVEIGFRFVSRKMGLSADKFKVAHILSKDPVFVGFSKKAAGRKGDSLAQKFGKTARQLAKEGVIQQIMDKYLQ